MDDDDVEVGGDVGDTSTNPIEAWDADNMVAVPTKIGKITLNSMHQRKHVDVKQIKNCLWDVISSDKINNIEFGFLFNVCERKLPGNISKLLTAPLIFNALLHLTNEKSLVLLQSENLGNFSVSK